MKNEAFRVRNRFFLSEKNARNVSDVLVFLFRKNETEPSERSILVSKSEGGFF
jgi:hypothetical protein